jgi:hypothetical protein
MESKISVKRKRKKTAVCCRQISTTGKVLMGSRQHWNYKQSVQIMQVCRKVWEKSKREDFLQSPSLLPLLPHTLGLYRTLGWGARETLGIVQPLAAHCGVSPVWKGLRATPSPISTLSSSGQLLGLLGQCHRSSSLMNEFTCMGWCVLCFISP